MFNKKSKLIEEQNICIKRQLTRIDKLQKQYGNEINVAIKRARIAEKAVENLCESSTPIPSHGCWKEKVSNRVKYELEKAKKELEELKNEKN